MPSTALLLFAVLSVLLAKVCNKIVSPFNDFSKTVHWLGTNMKVEKKKKIKWD